MTIHNAIVATALTLTLTAMAQPARAQATGAGPLQGQVEALGLVGVASDGLGAVAGGGLQFGVRPRVLVAVEFGLLTAQEGASGQAVNANVHYLFPAANAAFTPYVLGGLGYLRLSAGGFSGSDAGLNVGGGARFAVGESWGIRPEVKVFAADASHVQVTVGFYRRFK